MRLLQRWADTQLRADNERLRSTVTKTIRLARSWRDQRDAYRADAVKWRSIATSRADRIDELNEDLNRALDQLNQETT